VGFLPRSLLRGGGVCYDTGWFYFVSKWAGK
jgi:hypothetical protein